MLGWEDLTKRPFGVAIEQHPIPSSPVPTLLLGQGGVSRKGAAAISDLPHKLIKAPHRVVIDLNGRLPLTRFTVVAGVVVSLVDLS